MKKAKYLVLVLALAVMLMGAGYAYWSDTSIVGATVSTGELDVDFVNGEFPSASGSEYVEIECEYNDDNKATVTIKNMYPGAVGCYTAKIQNTGTIGAKFDNANIQFKDGSDENLKGKLMVFGGYKHYGTDNELKGEKYFESDSLNELQSALNDCFKDLTLEPGDYIVLSAAKQAQDKVVAAAFGWPWPWPWPPKPGDPEPDPNPDPNPAGEGIIFYLPEDVDNDDDVENKEVKFDMILNWTQFNNPLE